MQNALNRDQHDPPCSAPLEVDRRVDEDFRNDVVVREEQQSRRDHCPLLDGMRAVSILLVLSGHAIPLGPKPWLANATAATMGMSLFFSLSGFLITRQLLQNQGVGRFLAHRFARIVPLAWLYATIVFLVIQTDPVTALWTGSFVLNYMPSMINPDNAHLWSLCVEMQFYLSIAAVTWLLGPRALWLVWPLCLGITALRISEGAYIHIQTHLRVDEILAGACLATMGVSRARETRWGGMTALVGAIFLWMLTASPLTGWAQYLRPYATALVFLAVMSLPNNVAYRALSSRLFAYVAWISYAIYVIHPITMHGWLAGVGTFDKYAIKRPISLVLTFVLAHLSTKYWEKPWQRLARGKPIFAEYRRGAADLRATAPRQVVS